MYLCSDLRSVNEDQRRTFNYNKIGLFNDKNIKQNIKNMKESLVQKNLFLSSCKDILSSRNTTTLEKSTEIIRVDTKEREEMEKIEVEKHNKLKNGLLPTINNKNLNNKIKNIQGAATQTVNGNLRKTTYSGMMLCGHLNGDESIKKEVLIEFNKIFDKHLNPILKIKQDKFNQRKLRVNMEEDRIEFSKKSIVNSQIVKIKDKIHFMKGIVDYCFPKILIGKVKTVQNEQNFNMSNNMFTGDNTFSIRSLSKNNIFASPQSKISNNHFNSKSSKNILKNQVKVLSPLHIRSMSLME